MRRIFWLGFLPLLLGIALNAQQPAATGANSSNSGQGGFIAGSNTQGATMNGVPLLPGTAVLPGEHVTTASGGTATLVSTGQNGGVVQLGQQTATTVVNNSSGPQVNLTQGAVQAQGTVPVQTCTSVVMPQNNQTIVTVVANGCQNSNVQQVAGNSTVKSLGSSQQTDNNSSSSSQASLHSGQSVQIAGNQIQYVAPNSISFPQPSTSTTGGTSGSGTTSQSH